jgi:histidinol-phosphate phosphatase family protein
MTSLHEIPEAVFLDRDGVINEEVNLLHQIAQLRLIPGAARAIWRLNQAGVPAIVVTNQPVVARNLCTEEELQGIHRALEEMLKKEAGARLDAIYYCPHHPEPHPEGNRRYRIACLCRKPRTGMIDQACRDFRLNPRRCVLIGDSTRDVQAGQNAGTKTFLVLTGHAGADGRFPAPPDETFQDLDEAIGHLLHGE